MLVQCFIFIKNTRQYPTDSTDNDVVADNNNTNTNCCMGIVIRLQIRILKSGLLVYMWLDYHLLLFIFMQPVDKLHLDLGHKQICWQATPKFGNSQGVPQYFPVNPRGQLKPVKKIIWTFEGYAQNVVKRICIAFVVTLLCTYN